MLVVISDLHLTDGTTGRSISPGAFRLFRERLSDMAYDASKRSDGTYRPIEGFDIILLGDILDHIRTTLWTDDGSSVRPWSSSQSNDLATKLDQITDAVLEKNAEACQVLKELDTEITIPPATSSGTVDRTVSRDPQDPNRLHVQVRLHYLVGNHDWFLRLPGERYELIRRKVVEALGLANLPGPFPHDPWKDSDQTQALLEEHSLFAIHGDIFDGFNFDARKNERNFATLGDALVVELFNPFPKQVEEKLRGKIDDEVIEQFYELGNITPSLVAPVWINSLLERYRVSRKHAAQIKAIWDSLADNVLDLDFVKKQDTIHPVDPVDIIQAVLKFSKLMRFDSVSDLTAWVYDRLWDGEISYAEHAHRQAKERQWAQNFVFGHTHGYEVVPLDVMQVNGRTIEQIYHNSGTWRLIHQLTQEDSPYEKFASYNVMTYLGFFKGDERGGRRFESWTGTLSL